MWNYIIFIRDSQVGEANGRGATIPAESTDRAIKM